MIGIGFPTHDRLFLVVIVAAMLCVSALMVLTLLLPDQPAGFIPIPVGR
jgi:hypothetical protein